MLPCLYKPVNLSSNLKIHFGCRNECVCSHIESDYGLTQLFVA